MVLIHTILHPNDYSGHSEEAFHLACALARDYHARLVVLHVAQSPPVTMDDALDEALSTRYRKTLENNILHLQAKGFPVEVENFDNAHDPAAVILQHATDCGADLIVMGTHGRTGFARLLMGSVAEYVLRRAPCPVVTVTKPVEVPETPISKPRRNPVQKTEEQTVTIF
jgi:nucleotide-binding universal stress UspA family protein